MYTLILSISCSVAVSVLLKIARSRGIRVDQAIACNYVTAATLCWLLLGPTPGAVLGNTGTWPLLVALGLLLPSVFLIMAKAVEHAGIVLSDVAQRLSLLLPLMAAFVIFGEPATPARLAGIAVALAALAALLWRPTARTPLSSSAEISGAPARPAAEPARGSGTVILLLGVWAGYGVIDILFKQMARMGAAFPNTLLGSFMLAGAVSFTWLALRRTAWNARSMLAGLLLGLLNFGNIYFYVRAHQVYSGTPTLVFSAMNIGVISLGTLVGAGLFRERIHPVNALGIALAITAIFVLFPR